MLDNKTDVMIHKFMDMLDHSYEYKTSNERNKIERKIRDIAESAVKNLNIPAVVNWVAVTDRLPEEKKFRMSADVLTIAGDKMSVKCYDYELMRWTGSPHITVKYWMPLPEPPCL